MKKVLIFLIRLYQLTRPLRPPACRFYPSCSSYACLCVERFGLLKGGILAIWRLLRCQPFSEGGLDEVPEKYCFSFFSSLKTKQV